MFGSKIRREVQKSIEEKLKQFGTVANEQLITLFRELQAKSQEYPCIVFVPVVALLPLLLVLVVFIDIDLSKSHRKARSREGVCQGVRERSQGEGSQPGPRNFERRRTRDHCLECKGGITVIRGGEGLGAPHPATGEDPDQEGEDNTRPPAWVQLTPSRR